MIRLAPLLLAATLALGPVLPAAAAEPNAPFELVRTLQALQDQIAQGSIAAHSAQRTLLSHIDAHFLAAPAEVWQAERNARAAIVYVLSGGQPATVKRLLELQPPPKVDERLLRGALAYVEGREVEARRLLADVDARTLPPALGGQISLAQSALIVRESPAKALAHLDFARLLMPGTLVEEAALRREVFVVSQLGDTKRFEALSAQYLRRFRHSIYAGNFRQRFAVTLAQIDFVNDPAQFPRLGKMLAPLEPDSQRDVYLLLARTAVNEGKTNAAVLAAEKARELSAPGSLGEVQARLYMAAASVVTVKGFDKGVAELKKIDRSSLAPEDVTLLEAALSVAKTIRDWTPPTPASKAAAGVPATVADTVKAEAPSAAAARAKEMLDAVDQLLKRGAR